MSFVEPLSDAALVQTWDVSWAQLGCAAPISLRLQLQKAWGELHRHYHSLLHLRECLAFWQSWQHLAARPAEVALALWFHDAVYEPASTDNELQSASWAARSLVAGGASEDAAHRVYDLIMATRHGIPLDGASDRDADLLLDIDLAILGAPTARFAAYDRDIRAEYVAIPERRYREGRRQVLLRFLERPAIYATAEARGALETQARHNLAGAITRLAQ